MLGYRSSSGPREALLNAEFLEHRDRIGILRIQFERLAVVPDRSLILIGGHIRLCQTVICVEPVRMRFDIEREYSDCGVGVSVH